MNIWELNNILEAEAVFKKENEYCYSAIFLTGDFNGVYDYNAGILQISIIIKHPKSPYNGMISISTIDDGGWQAQGNDELTEEKALKIIDIFNEFKGRLPTEEILNEKLQYVGMYGTYTG